MKASDFFKAGGGANENYRQFVWEQLREMDVDDLKVVDLGGGSVASFRMNLNQYAGGTGNKFKTKLKGVELYVGRVA